VIVLDATVLVSERPTRCSRPPLAARMLAIVSADGAFAEAELPHVVPDAGGVAGLLAS
jgi:hypothetical protein